METAYKNEFVPSSKYLQLRQFSRNQAPQQRSVKNSYTEFHENPTNCLVAETR
jgi:hypothetical protein